MCRAAILREERRVGQNALLQVEGALIRLEVCQEGKRGEAVELLGAKACGKLSQSMEEDVQDFKAVFSVYHVQRFLPLSISVQDIKCLEVEAITDKH